MKRKACFNKVEASWCDPILTLRNQGRRQKNFQGGANKNGASINH